MKKKVLLVGWDAADWKIIDKLFAEGKLPNLQSLVKRGVRTQLQTLDPPLSPMLWTSIATGFRADIHGIGGFIEPSPDGNGIRPVTSTSRKVKAIWNILQQNGLKSNVVAWWPSNPVEPINGVMVSNLFQVANKPLNEPWVFPAGTIHPPEMEESLRECLVHPHEITAHMLAPFVPNIVQNRDLVKHPRIDGILKNISQAATVHAASTLIQSETEWDFMAVYHDALDHFCHIGMKFQAPHRPEIDKQGFENFQHVVEAGYRFHDLMLGRTLELADENTTILLISDHGFYSEHQRPTYIPNEPSGPAVEHSPYGVLVMAGPGIKKGEIVSRGSVLDITPTLLHYFGLPVGKDMEGKVLYQIFEEPVLAKYVDSWQNISGDTGEHDETIKEDPIAAQEAMQQLVELGYIDPPGEEISKQIEKIVNESRYYVARNQINGGRFEQAITTLKEIFEKTGFHRYGQRLATCYLNKRMYAECQELIEYLKNNPQPIEEAAKEAVNENAEEPMYLEFLEGLYFLATNQYRKAQPILEEILTRYPNNFQVQLNIAFILADRKRFAEAEEAFIKALAIDDQNVHAHHGLGLSLLRQEKYNEALDEFLICIDLNFNFVRAHCHLGETLFKLNAFEEAEQAFLVCLKIAPNMIKPHRWLMEIYKNHLVDQVKFDEHNQQINKKITKNINVLTGHLYGDYANVFDDMKKEGYSIVQVENPTNLKSQLADLEFNELSKTLFFIPYHLLSFISSDLDLKLIHLMKDKTSLIEDYSKKGISKSQDGIISQLAVSRVEEESHKFYLWQNANPGISTLVINSEKDGLCSQDDLEKLANFLTL